MKFNSIKRDRAPSWMNLIPILAGLIFVYWPVITIDYLYHDDVNFFLTSLLRPVPPSQHFNFAMGRYIGAFIVTVQGWFVNSVEDLKWIRLLTVFQFALTGAVLRRPLSTLIPGRFLSTLSVFVLLITPPFQIIASYAGIAFAATAILLSALAGRLIFNTGSLSLKEPGLHWSRFSFAIVLNFLALCVYPPAATAFWFLAFLQLCGRFRRNITNWIRPLLRFGFAGFISLAVYGLILKISASRFIDYASDRYNPFSLDSNLLENLIWFFREPLIYSLNFWTPFPSMAPARFLLIVTGFVAFYWTVSFALTSRQPVKQVVNDILKYLILTCLTLLAFLPNLLSSWTVPFYRCGTSLSMIVVTVILVSARSLSRILTRKRDGLIFFLGLCLLAVSVSLLSRSSILRYRVMPSVEEWSYFTRILDSLDPKDYQQVFVVQPREDRIYNRWDEFGTPTARYRQDLEGLFTALFEKKFRDEKKLLHVFIHNETEKTYYTFQSLDASKTIDVLAWAIRSAPDEPSKPNPDPSRLIFNPTVLYTENQPLHYLGRNFTFE